MSRWSRWLVIGSTFVGALCIIVGAMVSLRFLDGTRLSSSSPEFAEGLLLLLLGVTVLCLAGRGWAGAKAANSPRQPSDETSQAAVARLLEAFEPPSGAAEKENL